MDMTCLTVKMDCGDASRSSAASYALITPARNEAQFIESTIRSIVSQSLRPVKWVVVSDGSNDGTDEIVERYSRAYPWIELIRMPEGRERHFAAKVEAFNAGYSRIAPLGFSIIGNLDADVTIDDKDYFQFLMERFAENPRLGVAGTAYREDEVTYPGRFTSIEDVFGACQMFRRECFEGIGGYASVRSGGIDLIAFLQARSMGWQTRTFLATFCTHHRKAGSGQHTGVLKRLLRAGEKDYLLGSHPFWELCRSVYTLKSKPYVLAAVLMLTGYLGAFCRGLPRTIPEDLAKLRQYDQMQRLRQFFLRSDSHHA